MNQYPAKPMMDQMAQHGRYGDSMLVHMNPVEVAGIASLSPTGSLTTNPVTGQPEAFLPLLLGGLGSLLKLSPLMTGVLSGVGTAAVTGDLKRGLISGLTAGFGSAAGDALNLGDLGSGAEAGNLAAETVVTDPGVLTGQAGEGLSMTAGAVESAIPSVAADAAPTILDQAREAIPDALTQRPDFLKNVAPDFAPTFTQALVPATVGQSMLEQMDVQEDFERAERGRMAESEERKAGAVRDMQRGFELAQKDAPRGRSPMRARMDSYIHDYGTDLYAAGGGQMPRMQEGGQAENSFQEWKNSGSGLSYADWLAQGGSSKSDEPVVTSADLGQLVVDPTGDEAAVLAMAKGNQALTPAQQQVLEGYYNRYEQERQNRASQITETDSDFDLGAIARDLPSMFGYASSMNLGGIDPVTIQAGLRGEYAVRPPDDYMPGFEAEYSYFQDDPYAQKNPYRGYRPTTGGIESEGPYFDPILDRQNYKNKLKEYYRTLASYGAGTGPDDPDDPDNGDGGGDVDTPGQPDDKKEHIGWIWTGSPGKAGGEWVKTYRGQVLPGASVPQVLSVQKPLNPPEGFGVEAGGDDAEGDDPPADGREHIGWIWTGSPGQSDGEWVKSYRGQVLPSSVPQVMDTEKPTEPPEGFGVGGGEEVDLFLQRIDELMSRGMTREEAIANQEFAIQSGYDLNNDGAVTDAEYRQATTSGAGGGADSTSVAGGFDPANLPPNIQELIANGFGGMAGNYGLAGSSALTAGRTPVTEGQAPTFDATSRRGTRRMEGGGPTEPTVPLKSSLGQAAVPAGGIAEVDTQFSASPSEEEVVMLADAVLGKSENSDAIVERFVDRYGPEMFAAVRDMILKMVVPGAQTNGMIRGNGGGMDDAVPGMIGDQQPVAVSPGEFIVPADVVSDLGDGSSDAGSDELYAMMDRVRRARGGNGDQPPAIDARKNMPV